MALVSQTQARSRHRCHRLALAALALGLALPQAPASPDEPGGITFIETRRDHNRRVLRIAWEWVNSHYHDATFNGLDWEAALTSITPSAEQAGDEEELYTILKKMVGQLRDPHSLITSPREVREQGRARRSVLGFVSRPGAAESDPWTVVGIVPESPAAAVGIQAGWQLLACDGRPPAEVLGGGRTLEPGRALRCEFADERHQLRTAHLVPAEVPSPVVREARLLSGDRLYLRFDEFESGSTAWIREQLQLHPDASGLVLDLRYNPGGELSALAEIAGEFFAEPVVLGHLIGRSDTPEPLLSRRSRQPAALHTRIAVLVSEESMSCAEILAAVFQRQGRAVVLGSRTAGKVLGTVGIPLPGGGELQLSVWDFRLADGTRLERRGVTPDIALTPASREPVQILAAGIHAAVTALGARPPTTAN